MRCSSASTLLRLLRHDAARSLTSLYGPSSCAATTSGGSLPALVCSPPLAACFGPASTLWRGFAAATNPSATAAAPAKERKAEGNAVEVVLIKDVPRLGRRGSVQKANAGWVRHELFPAGKVLYATPENVKRHRLSEEELTRARPDSEADKHRKLVKLLEVLGRIQVQLSRKAAEATEAGTGEQPREPVTALDILVATRRQHAVQLDPSHLLMDQPIAAFGSFKVPLNLRTAANEQVELTVNVNKVKAIKYGKSSVS